MGEYEGNIRSDSIEINKNLYQKIHFFINDSYYGKTKTH